jgi:hypothetical protein
MIDWYALGFFAVFLGLLISSIVTGKSMTPMRGTRPFIVNRREHPVRYTVRVAINAGCLLVATLILLGEWTAK